jgi:hypothetical protein
MDRIDAARINLAPPVPVPPPRRLSNTCALHLQDCYLDASIAQGRARACSYWASKWPATGGMQWQSYVLLPDSAIALHGRARLGVRRPIAALLLVPFERSMGHSFSPADRRPQPTGDGMDRPAVGWQWLEGRRMNWITRQHCALLPLSSLLRLSIYWKEQTWHGMAS